ncbi:MAG: AgmX/PglI C-terminal domain-containing protein [Proteobacteria bacterium]|nr:AgmX/PglI C-terminal domain-containing protein [Pseudomonadota bacterium]
MRTQLKYLLPIALFMVISASAAQAQDANCNCGEIVKRLQEENDQLKMKLEQIEAEQRRRTVDSQELANELKKLQAAESQKLPVHTAPTNGKRLSPQEVMQGLNQLNENVKVCGQDGNLAVSFNIDKTGTVTNLKATAGSFKDTPIEQCILTVIQEYKFPQSENPANGIKYNFKL